MTTNTKWRLVASILFCLLFLAACDDNNQPRDTGPNASLSDHELLTKAVGDMKALKSYHFDVSGTFPSAASTTPSDAHIFGDMQTDDKGSRIRADVGSSTVTSDVTPDPALASTLAGVDVILANDNWYESYDSGNTWASIHLDTPAYLFIAGFSMLWDTRYFSGYPTTGDYMIQHSTFRDSNSTLENIDGVMTRHIVAEPNQTSDLVNFDSSTIILENAKTLSLWVSTDITPTIRQMAVDGIANLSSDGASEPGSATVTLKENGQPSDKPYHITWKWSRFDEDFGIINSPPSEKISTPQP